MAALVPTKPRSAFPVGRQQCLAGIGQIVHRVPVGEVDEAERERVDAGRVGKLVHRDFEQVHARCRARRPHVTRCRRIERGERIAEAGVVAAVHRPAPLDHTFGMAFVARGAGRRIDHDRCQLSAIVSAERHALKALGTVHVREHLLAGHHHANRAFELLGCESCEIDLPLRPQSRAECTPDEGIENANLVQ